MVVLHTNHGDITLELDAENSPATVANFLQYVRDGFYDGTLLHRAIPGYLVQGGLYTRDLQPKRTRDHVEGDLPEMRHADLAAKGASSIWKLYYAGSVGGQAILGIPAVKRLHASRAAKVWPFETGWKALDAADLDGVAVLVAEVYPSLFKAQLQPGEPKDQAQVRVTAEHFARLDEAGKLGELFAAPKGVSEQMVAEVEREEGWILGA